MNELVRRHRKTIELGRAIERAVEEGLPVTKVEIDKILAVLSKIPLDGVDSSKLIFWHHVGSRNPKPLMDELIQWMNALGKWSEPAGPVEGGAKIAYEIMGWPDYPTCYKKCRELVHDLNMFFIKIPRFTSPGRTKGKHRPKVTPEVKRAVQEWVKARNKKSRCSAASLARKLKVSRATLYRIIEEIG